MTKKSQRLYNIYTSILYRVKNKGLYIEKEWEQDYDIFKEWALLNNYSEISSLFLIDTNKGYQRDNCKWAEHSFEVRPPKPRSKKKCLDCESLITNRKHTLRCKKCASIAQRIDPTVDRKEYARNWALKKKYNISLSDFNTMLTEQQGKCKICNKSMEQPTSTRGQDLNVVAVDHCHKNGNVRGLLCNACNKGIGLLLDDIHILESAILYLKENNEKISIDTKDNKS